MIEYTSPKEEQDWTEQEPWLPCCNDPECKECDGEGTKANENHPMHQE